MSLNTGEPESPYAC